MQLYIWYDSVDWVSMIKSYGFGVRAEHLVWTPVSPKVVGQSNLSCAFFVIGIDPSDVYGLFINYRDDDNRVKGNM